MADAKRVLRSEQIAEPLISLVESIIEEEGGTVSDPKQDFYSRASFLLCREARLAMAIEIRDRIRALHVVAKRENIL